MYAGESGSQTTKGPRTDARITKTNANGSEVRRKLVAHFLSDTFGVFRKFLIFIVNDDCYREDLCLMAGTNISGARVLRELDAIVRN